MYVAIPDTLLEDSASLREKTVKLGSVARCCAIFGVKRIYVYRDPNGKSEAHLIQSILEYANTPQYLRKNVYGRIPSLSFAGLLPPLKAPHHKPAIEASSIKVGDFRQGFVTRDNGGSHVDVGLDHPVRLERRAAPGSVVTVQFTSRYPNLLARVVDKEIVKEYWGYEVFIKHFLSEAIREIGAGLTILTSRRGALIHSFWGSFMKTLSSSPSLLVVFGSPSRSIFDMLAKKEDQQLPENQFVLNFVPHQSVETVRSEEALLATLSIINLAYHLSSAQTA